LAHFEPCPSRSGGRGGAKAPSTPGPSYWYLGGVGPAYSALGIGKIAIAAGIRQSIECGRESYDFTRGPEPYKYWYGATDRQAPSLVVGNTRPWSRAALVGARAENARRTRAAAAASVRDEKPRAG